MASRILLTATNMEPPSSNAPQFLTIHSTEQRAVLAFDASTDEAAAWTAIVPQGWTGTPTAVITYCMASATSGTVGLQVSVEAISDGDTVDIDASTSYDTVNNSASTTVPGTAGYIDQITVTLTNNDSSAAGDLLRVKLNRDADGSAITDSATGDLYLISVEIRDGA
jgi:hypothetical protein